MACSKKKQKTIKKDSWWSKLYGYKNKKHKIKDLLDEHISKMLDSGKYLVHISYEDKDGKIDSMNCTYDYEFEAIKVSVLNFNEYFANTNTMKDNSNDASNKETD